MELKLIVLAGAKQGLEIPLKKDKFLIGRAKECSLRAGSEAISRRHCAVVRKDDGHYTVRDLGSRNGTYVNDVRITEEVPLVEGNELRVGPLHFRVAPYAKKESAAPAAPAAPAKTPEPQPTKPRKQPPVKDVADVIQRTVNKVDDNTTEDDVSRWLLGLPDGNGETNMKETLTFRMEETQAHGSIPANKLSGDDLQEAAAEGATSDAALPAENGDESKAGWSLFKRKGAGSKKTQPGKLPPRPEQQTKDSREAAADILREMTRRR
jgi:pSer/pThr/pTyr-binding forkhead associated (FHA) protein